jgi:diacylglycerol kinase
MPLMFCIEHRPQLARWAAAIGAAATLMASVMSTLNWLIVIPL